MRVLPLLVLTLWGLSSCRKQSSEAFHQLDAQQSVLISRDGDEAYVSPEMDQILAGLDAVPANAIEKDRAVALTGKLRAEQRRVRAEEQAAAAAAEVREPVAAPRPLTNLNPPEPEPVAPPEKDSGPPTEPWAGMNENDFPVLFGSCFTRDAPLKMPNGKEATTYAVRDTADCERHGQPGASKTVVLFVDGKLWGKRSLTTIDGGMRAPPPPPPSAATTPDAGTFILTVPGAPLPPGYQIVH